MAERSEAEFLNWKGLLYRHYKGGIYEFVSVSMYFPKAMPFPGSQIICEATHSETGEPVVIAALQDSMEFVVYNLHPGEGEQEPVVIYRHLYPNERRIWVRPYESFVSKTDDGKDRFTLIRTPFE